MVGPCPVIIPKARLSHSEYSRLDTVDRLFEPSLTYPSHRLRRERVEANKKEESRDKQTQQESTEVLAPVGFRAIIPLSPSLTAVISQWKVLASSAHRQLEA